MPVVYILIAVCGLILGGIGNSNGVSPVPGFFAGLLGGAVYFIPSFVASSRNHPSLTPIITLNALAGWSVLGWIVATVWAVSGKKSVEPAQEEKFLHADTSIKEVPQSLSTDISTQLTKLNDLRLQGALSDEEYQSAKTKLLA